MISHKEKILKYYEGMESKALDYLFALEALLGRYEAMDFFSHCPLCAIDLSCEDCPRSVLMDEPCMRMKEYREAGRVPARKAQLKRWIKAYEAAVKEFRKRGKV